MVDADGYAFWTFFRAAGGVPALGYPVSRRFEMNGLVHQAFQRALVQWNPAEGGFVLANAIDEVGRLPGPLEGMKVEDWLKAKWSVPSSEDWSSDRGKPWDDVVASHLTLLESNQAIKVRYLSEPDRMRKYGLPMGYADFGALRSLRAQRAVFQEWLQAGPWGPAGIVTLANAGDIAKEAGLFGDEARQPHAPNEMPAIAAVRQRETPAPDQKTPIPPDVKAMDDISAGPGVWVKEAVASFVEDVARTWGWRPDFLVTFYLYGTPEGFSAGLETVLGETIDRQYYEDYVAAVAVNADALTGGRAVVFKLGDGEAQIMDRDLAEVILAHEYTHVLQYTRMSDLQPDWFVEGMANTISFSTYPKGIGIYGYDTSIPDAARDGRLPSIRELHEQWENFSDSLERLNLAYGTAYYAVRLMAARVGGAPLMQVLADVENGADFEAALLERTGFSLDSLDAALRASLASAGALAA